MKMSEAFPSKWLKAPDVEDMEMPVIMDQVVMEEMNDGKKKPVLYFQNCDKGLVLNVTNKNAIAAVYGDESDDWAGHPVALISVPVEYQGKITDGIRVRAKPQKQSQPKPAAYSEAKGRPAVAKPKTELEDDEIPF
jgi:hypothetical protein